MSRPPKPLRGLFDLTATPDRPRRKRGRLGVAGVVVAAHLALFAFITAQVVPHKAADPVAVTVALIDGPMLAPVAAPEAPAPPAPAPPTPEPPKPEPTPPKPTPAKPTPPKPAPPRTLARETPAPRAVATLAASDAPPGDATAELSDAEASTAATAASGGGGGECNMVRWLQGALRKNVKVQAAIARTHRGKAIMVWNGDWIRSSGEDGHGLAGVREAIMMEVAFAPQACRETQPRHGLVLISMNDAPGSPRLVVGSDVWRWSDLLKGRPTG